MSKNNSVFMATPTSTLPTPKKNRIFAAELKGKDEF
jgi:hypothetical protein